jgi:exodeoxyribonuclease VIII
MNPGVYLDLPADQYHAVDAVSATRLKKLHSTTPGHFKAWLEKPQKASEAMLFGTIAHAYLLEKSLLSKQFASYPEGIDGRMKDGKALKEKWEDEGKTVVSRELFNKACDAAMAVNAHLPGGRTEISLFTVEQGSNLLCKARIDLVPSGPSIWDLKTTEDASANGFEATAFKCGYHIQAAFYLDLWNALCGSVENKTEFKFLALETEPPYAWQVFKCSDSFLERGRQDYQAALLKYAECQKTNKWPMYPQEEATLFLPAWANK